MAQPEPVLPITIYDVSSFDTVYPPDKVIEGNPLSPGWRSAAQQKMPQHLIVQLQDGLCNISQIQFTTHEIYIPAMVEIYTSDTCPPQQWVKLGHAKMAEGPMGNARDRKTFKFQTKCKLVKFGFPQVMQNTNNTTGQVSITAVVIRGVKIIQQPQKQQYQAPQEETPKYLSKNTFVSKADSLKANLQIMKSEALQQDQLLHANRIKNAYNKISQLQSALDQLEIKKAAAIQREEYVIAHQMKQSIDQMQSVLEQPLENLIYILNDEEIPQPEPQPVIQQFQAPVQQVAQGFPAVQNTTQFAQPMPSQKSEIQTQQMIEKPVIAQRTAPADPRDEVPLVVQQDMNVAIDERKIVIGQVPKNDYALSAEEQAAYVAEQKRLALKKAKERENAIKRKNGQLVEEEEEAKPVQQQESNQFQTKFNSQNFDFQREMDALCNAYTSKKDAQVAAPPQLNVEASKSPAVSLLKSLGFAEVYIMLAGSKNVDHINEAIQFMICCLKSDFVKFCDASIALVNLIGLSTNLALFAFCSPLVCYAYKAILLKYAPTSQAVFEIDFQFLNVDDQLVNQKDNAINFAEMTVFMKGKQVDVEKALLTAIGKQSPAFNNDCQQLWQPMVARLGNQQKRVRMTAVNMLSTLSSFVCFPIVNFTTLMIKKQNIDRIGGLKPNEQVLSNNKYFSLIEQRASAISSIIKQNYFLTSQIAPALMELIKWVFPAANKAEFKKSMIDIVVLLYETEHCTEIINLMNQIVKNTALFKQIQLKCAESDQERQGTARVNFVDQEGGRLVFLQENNDQLQMDFPPGMCQFCLWESPEPSNPDVLLKHLMLTCPCCCVCPACHMVVEVPVLPEHLSLECNERQSYQFGVKQCPKCRILVDERELGEHVSNCRVVLGGDQSCCPLCNEKQQDTEEALDHYAQSVCVANPRTTEKLKNIIIQKLQKE